MEIEATEVAKTKPDVYHCHRLLTGIGIAVIRGSGFGKVGVTYFHGHVC